MKKVIVVGAGASGMMAAIIAARNGNAVTLIEKNEKAGKKLFITGKGRCNLTNECDTEAFFAAVMRNPRFLYSAYSEFDTQAAIRFFQEIGLATKTERGNRVFPVSDKSSDVIRVLEQELARCGVKQLYRTSVKRILTNGQQAGGVETDQGQKYTADAVIVATGGLSYASTGSNGDGYRFAKELGHTVTDLSPSLVALRLKEADVSELEGLSLKNVTLHVSGIRERKGKQVEKELFCEQGEMLFTRNGISGPLVLSASAKITPDMVPDVKLYIDMKPALDEQTLETRVMRDFQANINKQFRNSLNELLPGRMADYIVKRSGIDPYCQVNKITAEARKQLCVLLKHLEFQLEGLAGYSEAVITRGGISVKEVTPATMESKLVSGLYFTGEVLDLDAVTGGFNLQIAWTTGYAAGNAV